MRTYINARCLLSPQTGVQRYTRGLMTALGDGIMPIKPGKLQGGLANHLWEQCILPARAGGVLICPANTGPLLHSRRILTIHDASVFDHPEWFRPTFSSWYQVLLRQLARKVEILVATSEFSRRQLAIAAGVPLERFHVIPIGVDDNFYPRSEDIVQATRKRYLLNSPYFLYVGSLEPRKNLKTLLAAWQRLGSELGHTELILVGVKGHVFRASGLEGASMLNVRLLGHVPEEDLPALYCGAVGVVYPTLYEGFGLPVLEAMACGVPVCASRIDVITEVAGDAFLAADPLDEAELAGRLRTMHGLSPAQREAIVLRGRARAALYPWKRTAEAFIPLLESLQ